MVLGSTCRLSICWCLHCRCNPGVGLSLPDLASDMLLTQAVSERSQNQNAGFSGWFVLAVALQNTLQFRRVLLKGNPEYVLALQSVCSRCKLLYSYVQQDLY